MQMILSAPKVHPVPRKRPRRRAATNRPRPVPAQAANEVWAYDFIFDACANGQRLKCLTVIDELRASAWRSTSPEASARVV